MLHLCRERGTAGSFTISSQALDEALAAGHSSADVQHALARASRCIPEGDRWRVEGHSLDGTDVTMFVAVAAGDLVVLRIH
jgi:hypothetical protein